MTATPPGWYPDAQGVVRWFDGTAWTEHTQGTEPPPPPGGPVWTPGYLPPGTGTPAQVGTTTPRDDRGILTALGVVSLLLAVGIVIESVLLIAGS